MDTHTYIHISIPTGWFDLRRCDRRLFHNYKNMYFDLVKEHTEIPITVTCTLHSTVGSSGSGVSSTATTFLLYEVRVLRALSSRGWGCDRSRNYEPAKAQ